MRVGVLTTPSLRNVFVANVLCERLDVRCIVTAPAEERSWRDWRPQAVRARVQRMLLNRRYPLERNTQRFFFGDDAPTFQRPELVSRAPSVNDPAVVEQLHRAGVDFVAVCGATQLHNDDFHRLWPEHVWALHDGLAPWYRGDDCAFWALYNNDPQRVGSTVLRVDRQREVGRIVAHACPAIEPGDCVERLQCEATRLGAAVFAESIVRFANGESLGRTAWPGGRRYDAAERTVKHERELRERLEAGSIICISLPERVTWYEPDAPPPQDEWSEAAERYWGNGR